MSLANTAPPHLQRRRPWPVGALQVSASGGHLGSEPCESDGFWVPFPSWVSQFKIKSLEKNINWGYIPNFFQCLNGPYLGINTPFLDKHHPSWGPALGHIAGGRMSRSAAGALCGEGLFWPGHPWQWSGGPPKWRIWKESPQIYGHSKCGEGCRMSFLIFLVSSEHFQTKPS